MKHERWHDADPAMASAVNMLQNAKPEVQSYCAEFMIEQIKSSGYFLNPENVNEKFNCFWRRWQDESTKMFEAMEYLRLADFELQKEVSLKIIDYIKSREENN
ncbi:hypothetical protein tpqmel_0798 [Candidatus Gastranaerophilus sp. (ex Termes propinquus)]|nr:hypothetical protein tpqmel_0798 [Candidatus Gastranaerophilus sp. (ex Termes propinquus)]